METAAATMVQQIEDLLQDSTSTLAHVEDTLTEGYAKALALEAERLRIERQLGEMARSATAEQSDELRTLGRRLGTADVEIRRLRALLGPLHDRARSLRAASAA